MDYAPAMDESPLPGSTPKRIVRNLKFTSYESTPTTSRFACRKRKSRSMDPAPSPNARFLPFRDALSPPSSIDSSFNDSCLADHAGHASQRLSQCSYYELSFQSDDFTRSSPYNRTSEFLRLSSSLQRCSLLDLDCAEDTPLAKRVRWDEDFDTHRKSNSAPGTPQRCDSDEEVSVRKFRSQELTPTKVAHVKIGTPERNQILYPHLIEVKPETKPKSPQKFRADLKRPSKIARKRLFATRDFMVLFTRVKNQTELVHKILSYLPDRDLVSVAQVSKLWKGCLEADSAAYHRCKQHVKMMAISKENLCEVSLSDASNTGLFSAKKTNCEAPVVRSPPSSPSRDNWRKFAKLGTTIDASQRLTKCVRCAHPAVLEKHIAQCSRSSCLYIWCTKCFAGSRTGPTDFLCFCVDARSPQSPRHLLDISNLDNVSASSFFGESNGAHGNSSSGYFSQSEHEKSTSILHDTSTSFSNGSKSKHTVLTNWNKNCPAPRRGTVAVDTSSTRFHHVAQQCRNQSVSVRRSASAEAHLCPSSPPKVKLAAVGSKKSKKNLRRLCL